MQSERDDFTRKTDNFKRDGCVEAMKQKRVFALFLIASMIVSFAFSAHGTSEYPPETDPVLVQLDIGIKPNDFRNMISERDKDPYPVWVRSDGGVYRGARINIRGSSSKDIGMLMPTKRVPFELVFDSGADAITPFANPSVKFINCFMPYRLLAEYIGLDLFASSGIPTPEHAFAFVRLNDTDFGVYLAVEDVNKHFISKHFSGNIGSLYKGSNSDLPQTYLHTKWFGDIFVKTDRGSQTLSALLAALERGKGFENYLDMDEILRFFACTAALGGNASIFTEQCNFMLYDNGGKFVLLPWDLSEAFCAFLSGNGIDHFAVDVKGDDETGDPNPLFELIMQNPAHREKYHAIIREINDTFLAPERVKPYLLSLIRQIAPYLLRDRTIFRNVPDLEKAMTTGNVLYTDNLLAVLDEIHIQLRAQLDGKIDSFYLNPDRFVLPDMTDHNDWFDALSTQTQGYDASVVEDVCDAYPDWHGGFVRDELFHARKDFFIAAIVFAPCFMIVLFRRRILALIRAAKGRKAEAMR